MKGMDLFCASPASTTICTSSDPRSMIRRGGKPIDRHSPRHHHHIPRRTQPHVPCSSQLMPIVPRAYTNKTRASSSKHVASDARRKSSADIYDLRSPPGSSRFLLSDTAFDDFTSEPSDSNDLYAIVPVAVGLPAVKTRHPVSSSESPSLRPSSQLVVKPSLKPRHPVSSSDSPSLRPSSQLVVQPSLKPRHPVSSSDSPSLRPSSQLVVQPTLKPRHPVSRSDSPPLRSSHSTRARDQVVVLRVSLHCKGCESKLKRHLSKIEGVTSYSIDMETKKVTIRGNITPLGVLSSVSRVKYAQLWPSSDSSSALQSPSWSA